MRDRQSLLELPFDQYQRYRIAADLVTALGVPGGGRVIDVGGAPGFVEDFLPDHEVFVLDVEGTSHGRFVLGDGSRMPFPDRAFSAVLALDTLEHVPPATRAPFLAEVQRVADVLVLSAPFASVDVELAEAALLEFVNARLGVDFPTLEEHSTNGLPVLEETVELLGGPPWATATLPSGYLPHWLAAMLVHHELLASGLPALNTLHAYYNSAVSPSDTREPAYRHVVVASRLHSRATLQDACDDLRSPDGDDSGHATLQAIAGAILSQRVGSVLRSIEIPALEAKVDALQQQVASLERQVADRDARLIELHVLNDKLLAGRRSVSARAADRMSEWWKGRRP